MGAIDVDYAPGRADVAGITVRDALDAMGFCGSSEPAAQPAAYVELHVECAPELERAEQQLAAFNRWWG